jgi:hypothetical protein
VVVYPRPGDRFEGGKMRVMRLFSLARRGLVTATLLGLLAAPSAVQASIMVRGRVLGPAGVTPIQDAHVTFYNLVTNSTHRSEATTTDGEYTLPGLAEGRYDVAVVTDRGLWMVDQPVTLEVEGERVLSFALRERAYWEGADQVPPRESPLGENVVGTAVILESEEAAAGKAPGRKRQIIIWSLVGATVIALVFLAADDEKSGDASPFTP